LRRNRKSTNSTQKAQTHIAKPQRFAPKHALLNKLQAH